jgi:hypothetical protein
MTSRQELKVGSVYFGFSYENDDHAWLMINSYEYLGRNLQPPGDVGDYLFRYLDSEDDLVLAENQLETIFDLQGLIDALSGIRKGVYPKAHLQAPSKDR